jgi:adenine-specific DNA-methyltransferase
VTPGPIADFMASLFSTPRRRVRILNPGAGVGTLTAAVVDRLLSRKKPPEEIEATCYEVDARLFAKLAETLEVCREHWIVLRTRAMYSGECSRVFTNSA